MYNVQYMLPTASVKLKNQNETPPQSFICDTYGPSGLQTGGCEPVQRERGESKTLSAGSPASQIGVGVLRRANNRNGWRGSRGCFSAGHSADAPGHVSGPAWRRRHGTSVSLAGTEAPAAQDPVAPGLNLPHCLPSHIFGVPLPFAAEGEPLPGWGCCAPPTPHPRAGPRTTTGKPEECHFVGSTKLERAGCAATKWLPPSSAPAGAR